MERSITRVGLVGTGVVGTGVVQLLLERPDLLERRTGARIELARVAEIDPRRAAAAGVPEGILVDDYRRIVEDPAIDVVVELIGGTGIAEDVVRDALRAKKNVVTANKALLAEKGRDLFRLARENNVPLLFEAAVCGGIPLILALREGLLVNRITSLLGIVNGTCNHILTEMIRTAVPYDAALADAQALGLAEADPTFDVQGIDSGHKLAILSALAFDTPIDFDRLRIEGIDGIDLLDVHYAEELGYTVKLLAVARVREGRLFLSVHPALLPMDHPLANVHGSLNAVSLYGDVVMESMFYGRGAGRHPTASAVVADIAGIAHHRAYDAPTPFWTPPESPAFELGASADCRSRFYLRFTVEDRPGVLGRIGSILGDHRVSIATASQRSDHEEIVPLVVLTHEAREGDVTNALAEIGRMVELRDEPVFLRIEP